MLSLRLCLVTAVFALVYFDVAEGHLWWRRACYKCNNAVSHEHCNAQGMKLCHRNEGACYMTIETDLLGNKKIKKGCTKSHYEICLLGRYCEDKHYKTKCYYCCFRDFCNVGSWPPPRDPCRCTPCKNGATCTPVGSDGGFQCTCKPGFTGKYCENRVSAPDPCRSKPCKNGGTCRNLDGDWDCDCPDGWTGRQCEKRDDPCKPENPCLNGGQCVQSNSGGYTCRCPAGFEGDNCEIEKQPCRSKPCLNGATCTGHRTGYTCTCSPNWTGLNCENARECFKCVTVAGLFPDVYNCSKFYHCAHSIPYHKDCPRPLHFNPRLKVCDWPAQAGCVAAPDPHSDQQTRSCDDEEECRRPQTRSLEDVLDREVNEDQADSSAGDRFDQHLAERELQEADDGVYTREEELKMLIRNIDHVIDGVNQKMDTK